MTGAHVLLNLPNCATAQAYSEASLPLSIIVNGTKGYDKTSIYLLDICTCKLQGCGNSKFLYLSRDK